MDTSILLGYFLKQDGLATLHEVQTYFAEVATPDLLTAWDSLVIRGVIGILFCDGVFMTRDGMILYSVSRATDRRYRVMSHEELRRESYRSAGTG